MTTRRRNTSTSESSEQATVVQWALMQECVYPQLRWLHSSLNGVYIPAPNNIRFAIMNRMKREGMKKGIPDLFLPAPSKGYHGLYVEMKKKGGEVKPEQWDFLQYAESVGYMCAVCYGSEEAIKAITDYLA